MKNLVKTGLIMAGIAIASCGQTARAQDPNKKLLTDKITLLAMVPAEKKPEQKVVRESKQPTTQAIDLTIQPEKRVQSSDTNRLVREAVLIKKPKPHFLQGSDLRTEMHLGRKLASDHFTHPLWSSKNSRDSWGYHVGSTYPTVGIADKSGYSAGLFIRHKF